MEKSVSVAAVQEIFRQYVEAVRECVVASLLPPQRRSRRVDRRAAVHRYERHGVDVTGKVVWRREVRRAQREPLPIELAEKERLAREDPR
jgi:hypothetical protein